MRVIAGTLKSRKITLPKGVDTRPTTDRTKESLFSIIDARKGIEGVQVLDLFSGSGSLAFEAISRGSRKVVCVEQNKFCVEAIQKNANAFGVSDKIAITQSDVWSYIHSFVTPYDFIFADPPYDYPYMEDLISIIIEKKWIKEDGWFVLEHDRRHDFTPHEHCVFSKPYGRTIVTIFLANPVQSEE